ncbi:putative fungal-specific transcription factor [Mycena belliarum]|uniref:Fungal-specific transcription factor n=1 Tax=Mycena belliarum TaxID=1033014 RepID=A0AAD6UBW5_9AGAR|nr:putative fungal-specific transcription factor [Mycena belliae]
MMFPKGYNDSRGRATSQVHSLEILSTTSSSLSKMSTPASDLSSEPKSKKVRSDIKRRTPGACDICKKRKIRCDSGQMPGNRCTNCLNSGLDCTHAEVMKTLGSAKGYVESLETRLEKMERLLNKLLPGIDFTEQLDNDDEPDILANAESQPLPRNDADHLVGAIKKLTLNPEEHRFFGKSSGIQLVQTALNFKSHYAGPQDPLSHPILQKRRNEYWDPVKWLLPPPDGEDTPQYTFPEPDLLQNLVHLYFTNFNCYYPVLHRPTFERRVQEKLHLRDHRFAATLLMVCALGSRNSDDPRVSLEDQESLHSAGWKWHEQVRVIPKHLIYKPNLYELQTIALSSLFLLAVSPVAWTQIGFGLRRAQDVGAHRRMKQSHPTVEHEQWRRVFWVLLCLDWMAGTATGRPLAMHDQDYDQDYPTDCDDDFWELPEPLNFRQPNDKPSDLSYFVHYAKLLEIQASVTSTIYSPRKPRDIAGRPFQPSDAQNIIAFDSALNSWLLEIPDHLRWDPNRQNQLHFNQSALLYAGYYSVQIMVHRPYIPAPLETSRPGALPSLAICTNAARSCARIFDVQNKLGIEPNQNMLAPAFTAAIVLLLNTWSGKRSGFTYNPSKELDDVYKCITLLKKGEKRYLSAGRFNDILVRLISVGDTGADGPFTKAYKEDTAPPSAQTGYEPSMFLAGLPAHESDPAASRWPTELTQQLIEDFNQSNDKFEASLRSKSQDGVVQDVQQPNHAPIFGFGSAPGTYSEIEQFMLMDQHQFPPDMLIDSGVMSMWSTIPSGFQLADWESYIMANPQTETQSGTPDQLPGLGSTYL